MTKMHIIHLFIILIFITPTKSTTCLRNRTSIVTPTAPPTSLRVPQGFSIELIATLPSPRHLTFLPSGDLIVGTSTLSVYIVPNADTSRVGTPTIFATIPSSSELSTNGVFYYKQFIYVGTQYSIWRIRYVPCALKGTLKNITLIRQGPIAPTSDGNVHRTTSVAANRRGLFLGIGSSCNACPEVDPTRASIQLVNFNGSSRRTYARRWRNPLALATHPRSDVIWAGGAGQDSLPAGHPYEFMDGVSSRPLESDYGWPDCEENRVAYTAGANCSQVVVPTIVFPAYSTVLSAVFYPIGQPERRFRFPASYREGMFVSLRGSWHRDATGAYSAPPRVVFVPFNKSTRKPKTPVSWTNPSSQWTDFLTGLEDATRKIRYGRTTGLAVGPQGSLFVADDQNGYIYRIRPTIT